MPRTLVTAAAELAVTLPEFVIHARIDGYDDSSDTTIKLTAAQNWVEDLVGPLVSSVWDFYLADFPCEGEIILPAYNLISVASLAYTDTAGTTVTWTASGSNLVSGSTTMAHVDTASHPGKIVLAYQQSWPSAVLKTSNPIVIRHTAGWASASAVPAKLKQAVMARATSLHRQREDIGYSKGSSEILRFTEVAEYLLSEYRIWNARVG